jgi:hypothetical protein
LLCGVALVTACEDKLDEPAPSPRRSTLQQSAKPIKTLTWTPPPTWNVERTAQRGEYRAKYSIPTAGDAKHPAELLVSKIGSASVDEKLSALLAEFEGEGVKKATREEMKVGDYTVKILEVGATYKFPMGPPMGPKGKRAAHVIKENWRALAAGVETNDRGNWFFRLVGPNDTVEGARSAFIAMMKGLK